MCQEHEDEDVGEYWGEIPESDPCLMCGDNDVHRSDRWNFQLEDENGTDLENFWICRACHSRFESLEQFDEFRRDYNRMRLYRYCGAFQRLLLMNAPEIAIAMQIKLIFLHGIRDGGKLGKVFLEELRKSHPDGYVEEGSNE